MRCDQCNFPNGSHARYCADCGHELQPPSGPVWIDRPEKSKKRHESNKHVPDPMIDRFFRLSSGFRGFVVLCSLIFFIAIIVYLRQSPTQVPAQTPEGTSNNSLLESVVAAVASKFICVCGSCGEQSLDICTCNKAIEERQVVRNHLAAGNSPDQIIAVINKDFGGLKPEFESRYGSSSGDPERITLPSSPADTLKTNSKQ